MADEDELDVEQLIGWEPASAPNGFAERVVTAWQAERGEVGRTRSRRWRGLVAAALVGALGVGSVLVWSRPWRDPALGELHGAERTSVALGERAIAVAEPGAAMRWLVERDGAAHIEQTRGAVFYRVDRSGPFVVETPHGSVRVTGTCFTVEVKEAEMDRKQVRAGALGAVLSGAVVVSVYEGKVVLADEGREVELRAGERGQLDSSGPRRSSSWGDDGGPGKGAAVRASSGSTITTSRGSVPSDPGELAALVRSQARELELLRAEELERKAAIERLQAQVRELGGEVEGEPAKVRARRCARGTRGEPGCSFVEPDEETLLEMARCGAVRADEPHFLHDADGPVDMPKDWLDRAGLAGAELERLNQVSESFRAEHMAELLRLYAEAGGDPESLEHMSPRAMTAMIQALVDRNEIGRAHRQLSRERAGLIDAPDPSSLSLEDRLVRAIVDVGERFEAKVAEQLGPERARALRRVSDGWEGGTSVWSGDCED